MYTLHAIAPIYFYTIFNITPKKKKKKIYVNILKDKHRFHVYFFLAEYFIMDFTLQ